MINLQVPHSDCPGILWPAMPGQMGAVLPALQHQLEASQWWPAETLLAYQLRQAEVVLKHAVLTVPFYRQRLEVLSNLPRGGLNMEAFRHIPVLHRTDIQEAGDALLSRSVPKEHGDVTDVSTSGSTGRPITVKSTTVIGVLFRALNLRFHLWHGRDFSCKVARISQDKPTTGDEKPLKWVPGYDSGPMVTFPVTRSPDEQLAWLDEQNPEYLLIYPSNLLSLLQRAAETGVRPASIREVITYGEVLDGDIRDACERVWALPVTDSYSAHELGMIALQCPQARHYHVQSESVLVEIVDADGHPCQPGEFGRVLVTDLHNFATPLIRYEIGDYAEAGGSCQCGRGLPVINRVLGRTRNMLTLPTGERLWVAFTRELRDALPPLRQAQLVQRSLGDVEARLVVARPLTRKEEDRALQVLDLALAHKFPVNLVYVDEISRSPGGKFLEFTAPEPPRSCGSAPP